MDEKRLDFATLAAHAGLNMRIGEVVATSPAIVSSTTFTYDSVEAIHEALAPGGTGFAYSRNRNPTIVALEEAVAELEGAKRVIAFGSGMAAIHGTLLGSGLQSGDSILAATDLYGVTRSLLLQLETLGIRTHFVDMCNLDLAKQAMDVHKPDLLFLESISNPLLRVADVPGLVESAHRRGAKVAVDNTFATSYLFRPLDHGADIAVYSATKYLAGHGDVIAGLVATNAALGDQIQGMRTLSGGVVSPFDAWLTLRGIRTLPVRLDRQSCTAAILAGWLEEQSWVERVYFPGLASHPQHEQARRIFHGGSPGVVSFDLRAGEEGSIRFIDGLKVVIPGTSIGDVASLILYPRRASHRGLSEEQLQALGIGAGLVRLSVGLESPADLVDDLARGASALN